MRIFLIKLDYALHVSAIDQQGVNELTSCITLPKIVLLLRY